MKFTLTNQGKEYQIEIDDRGQRGVKVAVNGQDFLFGAENAVDALPVAQAAIPKRDMSNKVVCAPLAGTISELNVKIGDIVKTGQKLLTLSAMKMENEILSECEGKIKEIKIAKDQKVMEGDTLIILA